MGGFRIQESSLGLSNDMVGRTSAVSGAMVAAGDRITGSLFRFKLTAIKVEGKTEPQFAKFLDTQAHPSATLAFASPVTPSAAFASGATSASNVTGRLTIHGSSNGVTFRVSWRRDGTGLQAARSIPGTLADWGIEGPPSAGFLGSLANHGVAEFLIILRRSSLQGG